MMTNNVTNTMTVSPGVEFTINLDAKPQTGFLWELRGKESVPQIKSIGETCVPKPGYAGCEQQFHFVSGLEPADTLISFVYKRSWEETPLRTAIYNVIVS